MGYPSENIFNTQIVNSVDDSDEEQEPKSSDR